MTDACCDCPEHRGETCRAWDCKHRKTLVPQTPEEWADFEKWVGPRGARRYNTGKYPLPKVTE